MSTPTLFSSLESEQTNGEFYHMLKDLQGVSETENAEQDTRLYEAQQTEQAVQGPDSMDESAEDAALWGSPPPPSKPGLALPIPAPPVVPGGAEPQTTAPPAPLGPDMVANNVPDESIAPELIGAPRPKQRRPAAKRVPKQQGPKRVPKRVSKPPKPLSANQLQKKLDREGMQRLRQRQADLTAAMMASGITATQPGQLYGQNQFCKNCGQNLSQATPGYYPPAGPGAHYFPVGPVYQQPPVPPAPFAAYAPAPASHLAPPPPPPPAPILPPTPASHLALSLALHLPPHLTPPPPPPPAPVLPLPPHLAPPPPPYSQTPGTTDPGSMLVEQGSEAATWQPLPQQQAKDPQNPKWYYRF